MTQRAITPEVGARITTRYFGGYERVDILQIHSSYYVVSRFGGQATDILPTGQIEKVLPSTPGEPAEGERK